MGSVRGPRWALAVLALLLVGCDAAGSATTRIDRAEDELEELSASIVEAVALDVASERPFAAWSRCQLPGGRDGGSSSMSLRGPLPDTPDPIGRSAALLVDAGYELVDSDLDEGVFGRRDGIRVTVVVDRPTAELAIDANTGCRPLPEG